MKKIFMFTLVLAIIICAASCNNAHTPDAETADLQLQANDSLFRISEKGYDFCIVLPKDIMIANSPVIHVNDATGELHIQVGNQFWIVASQEKTDMPAVKSAMDDDMLFTSRIVEENTNSVLYQRILPDGSEYDYSYRNICEVGGKPYVFKTCEEGEFSMESVNRMKQAICSVKASV